MPQWGANTNDESKPKNLTAEEKSRTFATTKGWEINRPDGTTEVLVAIRNLSGGSDTSSKLGVAQISQVYFLSTSYSTGTVGKVRVVWNERITPTTTGTLNVSRTTATSNVNITATRVGNTTSNFIDYQFTVPSTTGVTLTVPAQTVTQGVNDYGTTVTSQTVILAASVGAAALAAGGTTSAVTTI